MLLKIFITLCLTVAGWVHADPVVSPPPQEQTTTPTPLPTEPIPQELPSSSELTQSYESSFLRMIASLIGLIILIAGTFWVLKRLGRGGKFGKGSTDRSIRIIERRPLSPKSVLYLIEIGKKQVLISESQLEVRALSSIDVVEELEES